MDYVVGSVAALISGNVTPNRPKTVRRALTPTKHQPSPNVTPKSELVEDRSIFLSPSQQKKKAIVKKSPKRIFQNPDLDVTEDCEGNSSLSSPKAEKVKKHLKEELEADDMGKKKLKSPSSMLNKASEDISPQEEYKITDNSNSSEGTPKKKKKKRNSESKVDENETSGDYNDDTQTKIVETANNTNTNIKSPKKKQHKSVTENIETAHTSNSSNQQENTISIKNNQVKDISTNQDLTNNQTESKKKKKCKKKNKKSQQSVGTNKPTEDKENAPNTTEPDEKKNKKKKNSKNKQTKTTESNTKGIKKSQKVEKMDVEDHQEECNSDSESEESKARNIPNPNAITEKDSDSEHDSDDEIESENEQTNEKVLTNEKWPQESSDEEEADQKSSIKKEKNKEETGQEVMTEEEIKRTLFVGNVPFSNKCKKEIKKIFSKYGQIDTIRIRTIPVKDARVTPKLAIIKNELHPERTTVNVYVKYAEAASVGKAIAENNTVLNGNHLRVSRSDSTGAEHDPRCAVFVGNLPFAVEDDTLRNKFEKCGEITSVRIIRDKKTNAGKGFGYVNFASKDGVELALALSEEDLTIKNRILRVKRCTQTRGNQGRQQGGGRWGNQGQSGRKWDNQDLGADGAARRLMHKRKNQETSGDAPPNKRPKNVKKPYMEKKQRKEFVGMTAEKKKKQKFNKGLKKKKALSEILTK